MGRWAWGTVVKGRQQAGSFQLRSLCKKEQGGWAAEMGCRLLDDRTPGPSDPEGQGRV